MLIAPWLSSSSADSRDMTVTARTDVTVRIFRLVADGTDGPARLHERAHPLDERGRLRARDMKARDGRFLTGLLLFEQFLHFDHHAVSVLIVAGAEGGDDPGGCDGLEERGVRGIAS